MECSFKRENHQTGIPGYTARPQIDPPAFKVPRSAPRSRGRCGGVRNRREINSSKWTHYSLADVDEDAGTQRVIANDLLNQLREQRQEADANRDEVGYTEI